MLEFTLHLSLKAHIDWEGFALRLSLHIETTLDFDLLHFGLIEGSYIVKL